jgi:hypothetical protein
MMQAATDTAALEGARDLDGEGRQNAADVIRNVFDDDLEPTANSTTLGAGPDQSLVQRDSNDRARIGSGAGGQAAFANRQTYIYRPNPELNEANSIHGDMVRGDYDTSVTNHGESSAYARGDFSANTGGDALLIRLRRTPQRMGVANPLDREAGVSSSGSGSPLLLGHLAFFTPSPANEYDIRRDGTTIRATSIADRKPIVHIGESSHPSVFPAIEYAFSTDDNQWYQVANASHRLGETVQFVDSDPSDADIDPVNFADIMVAGYASIVWQHAGSQRVAGFRLLDQGESRHANVSPRLTDAWETLRLLTDADREAILERHRDLAAADEIDLAPALVRATR